MHNWFLSIFFFLISIEIPQEGISESCLCGIFQHDPDYRKAVIAFDTALQATVFPIIETTFPSEITDYLGYRILFDEEGKIHWKVERAWTGTEENSKGPLRGIHRTAAWTETRDPPLRIWSPSSRDDYAEFMSYNPFDYEEEEDFSFLRDYTVFPRAFHALEKDLLLFYQRKSEFYARRLAEFHRGAGIWHLTINDLKREQTINEERYNKATKILEAQEKLAFQFSKASLDFCIRHHNRPKAHFERGLFSFLEGETLDALECVYKAIDLGYELEALQNESLLIKAQMESEAGLYAQAIESLTKLIQKNPDYKEAYFERASAYFAKGDFNLAIDDYLSSGAKPQLLEESSKSIAFAMVNGILQGGSEAAVEYLPSVLSSMHGLGNALWAFAQHPIQVSQDFVTSTHECVQFLRENSSNLEMIAKEIVPELKHLIENWNNFSFQERGSHIGFVIGKYGIELFAGAGLVKAVKSYRNLKKANALLTLETTTLGQENRLSILQKANASSVSRKEALKGSNLKIEMDKQGKHISTHRNYQADLNKSILEHSDPQRLIDTYAGTGFKKAGVIGEAGYQEVVNFKEFIGYSVNFKTGEKIPTTWGKIHYSKNGTHIVPRDPMESFDLK